MTNAPNPGNEPERNPGNEPEQADDRSVRRRQWRNAGIVISFALLTGVGGGVIWLWMFVHRQLGPIVQNNVTRLLDRPVKLGEIESFSLNSLRFSSAELPATSKDNDRATVEAVEVKFDPIQLLLKRDLNLDVTLVKPDAYIEQDEDRQWVATRIKPQPKGAIEVNLQVLRLRDADVVLVPRSQQGKLQQSVVTRIPSGVARFLNDNQLIQFDLGGGQFVKGGNFSIQGESRPSVRETNLVVTGSNLVATEIGRLLQLPLLLQVGQLDSNLEVRFRKAQPLQFLGTATLKNVTARVPALPQPFANTNGLLRFKGTTVRLENVTSLFGQVPATANGALDTQKDFNLSAKTQPVELKQVLQTFNIQKLPVAASAQVEALVRVTGPLSKPFVSGAFATTKPAQIDRVPFRKITAGFGFVDSKLTVNNLRATPTVGGLVTGKGEAQLNRKTVNFSFQAADVPGGAIAKTYNQNLPFAVGSVSGSTQISGSLDNPQNIRATGSASLNAAGGTVVVRNVQLTGKRFSAQVRAFGVQAQQLGQVPPQFRGPLSGSFTISGALDNLSAQTVSASGSGRLNVAGGIVRATDIQLANGRVTAQARASGVQVQQLAKVPPQFRGPVSGNFTVSGALNNLTSDTIRASGSGRLNVAGGTVRATDVELANGRFTAQVQASDVQVQRLAKVPPQFNGPVSGNFTVSGALNNVSPQTIRANGTGRLNVAGGAVNASNVQVANGRFTAQVQASDVQVQRLAKVPPQFQGPVSGNFAVSGALNNVSPQTIRANGSGRLNVAGGTVNASNIRLANGRFTAQVRASQVQVQQLAQVPPQFRGPVSGNFTVAGALNNVSPQTLRANGTGRLNVAGGTVNASNVQLANGRFTAQVQASNVQVQQLAQVPPQLRGSVSGNFTASGALNNLSPQTISASGSGRLNVAGGTVNASNVQLANGRFQAVVEPTDVQLAGFQEDLRGRLSGRLNVSGSLAARSPAAIQASGQVNFSEGIALIDRPLTASFNWNGQRLAIQQATANGFNASGTIDVNLANRGLQAIQGLNLDVRASDLNLQQLSAVLPNAVSLAGRADFDGRIAGTPTAPNVSGNLQLRNFAAGGLAFDPVLRGQVSALPQQGVNLQLTGDNDQIQVAIDANYKPVSFLIQRDEAVARGTRSGEQLVVNAQNFPVALIKQLTPLPPAIAAQPLSGQLSGDLAVNLNTYGISGNVAIAKPIIGSLRGDSFTATLQYTNGEISLQDGKFQQGDNQYLLSGNLKRTATGPEFDATLDVAKGELQNVLTALQVFDLTDLRRGFSVPTYGRAADLATVPVGVPEAPLQTQLRRLSEIKALLAQRQEQEDASPLPDIATAKGSFTGQVKVEGSPSAGISAEFDIRGQDWEWGPYGANLVNAQGNFQNGVLTLLPLRFETGDRIANFSGTIGGEAQSGQLQLRNIPIAELQDVFNVPSAVGFSGLLNATATLSGSIKNPQARGDLSLTDATLNDTPVRSAQGSFSYNNARLNFGSTFLVAETDPLTIGGSVPYKLPFASVAPTDNELSLNVDVQNQGLALLNLVSGGQVSWVDGTGDVQLQIAGTIDPKTNRPTRLEARGTAIADNATIQATALPQPLQNVSARVLFDLDRIQVETVRAQFSDGIITAAGTIPISRSVPQENPLTINIGELAFNLKGLYDGRVRGDVTITGTALAPKIGGEVNLFDGQVDLAESGAATGGGGGSGGGESAAAAGSSVEFENLELTLGENIQVTRAPILNFLAEGKLAIEGSLDNIRPRGAIALKRGQVNLFTTQFRLARGYENKAQFTPERGLDPLLDVRLTASVAETTASRRLPTDPLSAEFSDTPSLGSGGLQSIGSIQTVRVDATVEGPASQLFEGDSIELTSSPNRSEAEIVALLGGGFVDTLGRGDTTLGLANLAGSALLSNVQNVIGDALGLTEFRLFPTILTNDEERTSTLGLVAEAGLDITGNFSVSVLKELTTDLPFQYSLRYRLNDEVLLRGATDLSGETRAVVEYETRF